MSMCVRMPLWLLEEIIPTGVMDKHHIGIYLNNAELVSRQVEKLQSSSVYDIDNARQSLLV